MRDFIIDNEGLFIEYEGDAKYTVSVNPLEDFEDEPECFQIEVEVKPPFMPREKVFVLECFALSDTTVVKRQRGYSMAIINSLLNKMVKADYNTNITIDFRCGCVAFTKDSQTLFTEIARIEYL